MTPDIGRHAAGAVAGLVAVVGPALAVRRGSPRRAALVAGGGLVGAAAALTALAARRGGTTGDRLLAAGWASHALFDALHHAGERSLIPSWYPAACASFDLTMAAALLRARG